MNALNLIRELADTGVYLTANGDKLHVEAKPGTVTPELRQRLADRKAELLPLVRIRDRLLSLARSLGLPDDLVLRLPESELIATAEQVTWCGDDDTRHKLLVFYLRSLAGEEPALPGSLYERDATKQQAHVKTLRKPNTTRANP